MSEFNALLGQHGLPHLETAARHRNQIADLYRARLSRLPGIRLQEVRDGNRSSYKDFAIIVDADAFGLTRDELETTLMAENIETRKYYDPPVHRQAAYQSFAPPANLLPHTELLASSIINLPIWSHMDAPIASGICLAIERAHRFGEAIKAMHEEHTNLLSLRC
jgi:dTDP-4-amino-4,6-dideoxygalactose transaminase